MIALGERYEHEDYGKVRVTPLDEDILCYDPDTGEKERSVVVEFSYEAETPSSFFRGGRTTTLYRTQMIDGFLSSVDE